MKTHEIIVLVNLDTQESQGCHRSFQDTVDVHCTLGEVPGGWGKLLNGLMTDWLIDPIF